MGTGALGPTGCVAGPDPGAAPSPPPAPTTGSGGPPAGGGSAPAVGGGSSTPGSGRVVEATVSITGGRVTTATDRVRVRTGDTVRIVVTSDRADELHLHGYDLERELAAGVPTTLEFRADRTGLFELETHESGLTLLQLLVS